MEEKSFASLNASPRIRFPEKTRFPDETAPDLTR
jgi:hypothetical protein